MSLPAPFAPASPCVSVHGQGAACPRLPAPKKHETWLVPPWQPPRHAWAVDCGFLFCFPAFCSFTQNLGPYQHRLEGFRHGRRRASRPNIMRNMTRTTKELVF